MAEKAAQTGDAKVIVASKNIVKTYQRRKIVEASTTSHKGTEGGSTPATAPDTLKGDIDMTPEEFDEIIHKVVSEVQTDAHPEEAPDAEDEAPQIHVANIEPVQLEWKRQLDSLNISLTTHIDDHFNNLKLYIKRKLKAVKKSFKRKLRRLQQVLPPAVL